MKLFLTSFFKEIAELLPNFYSEPDGKKLVFIPTAANIEKNAFYIEADRNALKKLGFNIEDLDVSKASPQQITEKIGDADVVFVGGGNTFYLLQELRRNGADETLRQFIDSGKLFIGSSAGSIICSPNIEYVAAMDDPTKAPELDGDFNGLNVIDFYILPHFGDFPFAKATKKVLAEFKDKIDIRPISNSQAIAIAGDKIEVLEEK